MVQGYDIPVLGNTSEEPVWKHGHTINHLNNDFTSLQQKEVTLTNWKSRGNAHSSAA